MPKTKHPAILTPDSEQVSTPALDLKNAETVTLTWRQRFRDANGQPLPPDPVRIDVKTGERVVSRR